MKHLLQIFRKVGKPMQNHPNYHYFLTKNWNQLSIEQRKQLLVFVEKEQAIRQNRQPIPLHFQNISGFGSYSRKHQCYIISTELLHNNSQRLHPRTGQIEQIFNSFEALDTIIHEGYHREQHLLTMGNQQVMPYLQGSKREEYKRKICENFSNYSTPNHNTKGRGQTSFPEYYLQPLEISVVMQTNSDLVFNNTLYQDVDYQRFLRQKIEEEKLVRLEALKVYGPDYEKTLSELREIRAIDPRLANQREQGYRIEQERFEKENQRLSRER
ncbi:Uncharacterised protein [Streptococcus suis]|uniref:Uncharacterized protein n=2 Tax=Streptococcus suis TaxID=1307 RepID=A0A116NP29_STRSU|nr:Uncharacterised protein [Streptococcus suis]